jgi:hypothetical protein
MLRVFDLAETLVYSGRRPLHGEAIKIHVEGDDLFVHVRPFAVECLTRLIHRSVPCAIWSVGTRAYVDAVVHALFEDILPHLRFVRAREETAWVRVSSTQGAYLKDLSGMDAVLYDDNHQHQLVKGNRVELVPKFTGARDDQYLKTLFCIICREEFSTSRQRQALGHGREFRAPNKKKMERGKMSGIFRAIINGVHERGDGGFLYVKNDQCSWMFPHEFKHGAMRETLEELVERKQVFHVVEVGEQVTIKAYDREAVMRGALPAET